MKKRTVKVFSLFLSVILLLSGFTCAVFAADNDDLPIHDYVVPTGLTARYGDYLHSVFLPEIESGYFMWDESYTRSTRVGNVGKNTFLVTYYPPNLEQFQTVHGIEVQIEVFPAKPQMQLPEGLTGYVGKTLADVVLPECENGVFAWEIKSPEAVVFKKPGEYKFTLSFFPNDNVNYHAINGIEVVVTVSEKACEHENFGEWKNDGNSTFFKDGTETRTCPDCGKTETRLAPGSAKYNAVPVIGALIGFFIKIFEKIKIK